MQESRDEFVERMRQALKKIDGIVTLYKTEFRERRFRPRHGEKWERTVEKQIVEVAILELQQLNEEQCLEEMCKLVDEIEEFAEKARVVDV